jgi:hypothetical protein
MADARGPWNEVGDRLGALALKLKLHAQEEMSEQRKADARSAVERLGASVQGAIEGISDAAKDPAVKEDAKAAGEALTNAVNATLDELRKAFRSDAAPGGNAEPAGSGGKAEPAGSGGKTEPTDAPKDG